MDINLYNTLTRKKEIFVPIKKSEVGMYSCGPTVYNYAHIGNLRSYIFGDTLKRVLIFNNFKVKHVMNVTDVGHLTSDSDSGEDKMVKGAKREKKSVWEIAEFYLDSFKKDIRKLNILKPNFWPRATDHITDQIELIKKLEKKGFTYTAGGNVYFDTSKLGDYGKLALLDINAEQKSRVQKDLNKKNKHDFVLWFTKSKFSEQEMKWNSPWGTGYPGWHIECSAMSMKFLGQQFDIHLGGIDHIPIHHTNEIAQSESVTGKKPWVKYWLHNEFLVLEQGQKMAKSGNNFITLTTLEKKGFFPLDYRYFCLGTVYRKPLYFSWGALNGAKNARKKLVNLVLEIKNQTKKSNQLKKSNKLNKLNKKYLNQFTKEINNNLNTPKALATLWEVLKEKELFATEKLTLILKFDEVLGLGLKDLKKEKKLIIPVEIKKLINERLQARNDKDWVKADNLRLQIQNKGYLIKDIKNLNGSKESYTIKKI